LNQEDISRYVDLNSCDYVVDLQLPDEMVNEEVYFNASSSVAKQFVPIWSKPYLHNPTSPFPFRSLYIPGLSASKNKYGVYHVLANTARLPSVADTTTAAKKKKRAAQKQEAPPSA
jgi:alpha-1,2-mannosyltransferase